MKKVLVWASVLICAIISGFWQPKSRIAIQVLDVGQGDSVLVTTPKGARILIDGGPDDSVLGELAVVGTYLDLDIDYVVVTHTDSDHLFGIIELSEYYSPKEYFLNLKPSLDRNAEWWTNASVPIHSRTIWDMDGVRFETLWPTKEYLSTSRDPNNASVVMKITYKDFCALLTGDIEAEVEKELVLRYGDKLDCDFMKVPHHGSKTSSTNELLRVVSPRAVGISVGEDNSYKHPHAEVLGRYDAIDAEVLRTDELGRFTIWSDGHEIWWEY